MLFHGGFGDDEDDEVGHGHRAPQRQGAGLPDAAQEDEMGEAAARVLHCAARQGDRRASTISQGELKVVACFAPEKTMIQAYLDGLDLHAVTGAKLAQVDLKSS